MISLEKILGRYFRHLESKGKTFNILIGIACTTLIGTVDILAPSQASFAFLYLFPIGFVTWFSGKRSGLLISLVCAGLRAIDDVAYNNTIATWNILSVFAIFCTVSVMLSAIHDMWNKERELSREDHLTGALNLRAFSKLVEYEVFRLQRKGSPFSIVYLDLDNFKMVNDRFGHKKGDEVLKTTVVNLVENLRKTDVVARIGGDEFAIFLPATDSEAVRVVMDKVMERLSELSKNNQCVTTFSIGVVTCTDGQFDLDKILSVADKLMYEVKNSGRNNVCYTTLPSIEQ